MSGVGTGQDAGRVSAEAELDGRQGCFSVGNKAGTGHEGDYCSAVVYTGRVLDGQGTSEKPRKSQGIWQKWESQGNLSKTTFNSVFGRHLPEFVVSNNLPPSP